MNLLSKALTIAISAHEGQTRKGNGLPYIVHCMDVVTILVNHGITDESILAAGAAHDAVEDGGISFDYLALHTSQDVADIVKALSKPPNLTKEEQKTWAMDAIRHGPTGARIVKMADRLSNTRDMSKIAWSPERKRDYARDAVKIAGIGANDCPALSMSLLARAGDIFLEYPL